LANQNINHQVMIEILFMILTIVFLGGIATILKQGNNEIVKGLESLDERLMQIENKLSKDE